MKKMSLALSIVLILIALLSGCSPQGSETGTGTGTENGNSNGNGNGNDQLVDALKLGSTFAISNEIGDRLITFTQSDLPVDYEKLDIAIGEGGTIYKLEYVKKQEPNANDSSRVVAANFDNMGGIVYNILVTRVAPDKTYFLTSSDVLVEKNLLKSTNLGLRDMAPEDLTKATEAKGRTAQTGWILEEYSDGTQILCVVFEPDGDNLLMSIALKKAESIKFMDYPAVLSNNSAWRVDDGGIMDPSFLHLMFSVTTNEGIATVISWVGAEGEVTYILIESVDALKEMPASVYRYWSPA
jgi:hypothetical protein